MRVGFITQLLWPRYGDFWDKLVTGIGAEALYVSEEQLLEALTEGLAAIPGLAFQLAAAQALTLQDADLIVAPDLNPGEDVPKGSGQDPWIASFPEALSTTFASLPPVFAVPASLEGRIESLAVKLLHALNPDAALGRRVWERFRSSAKPPRIPEPRWSVLSGETVGVLGQPWLLGDALLEELEHEQRFAPQGFPHGDFLRSPTAISQHQLAPAMLRTEGWRIDERLVATDAEVLGAARYFGRKGSIARLLMVADKTSGADAWLLSRVRRLAHKPLELIYLQDMATAPRLLAAQRQHR